MYANLYRAKIMQVKRRVKPMNKTITLMASSALALLVGCAPPVTTNVNTNTANTNTAVVVNENSNTAGITTNVNTNADTERGSGREVTREDFEKNKDYYSKEAKEAGRTIGAGANDLWLWTKTRAALATADDLRDSTINVDVDNSVVTLTGTVASAAQKAAAEKTAKTVEDVKSVKNMLKVSANGDTSATNTNTASDNTKSTKKGNH
jgi:hyperosmotically inducible periplasmic protein